MHRDTESGWNMVFTPNSKISIKSLFLAKNEIEIENKR